MGCKFCGAKTGMQHRGSGGPNAGVESAPKKTTKKGGIFLGMGQTGFKKSVIEKNSLHRA